MLTLTYIFHSGFVLEADSCLLVFDYWMDPAHVLDRFAANTKPVYVLASHFHEDHFNRAIFGWREQHPTVRYTYILSKDILRHRRAKADEADVWLAKGGSWSDDLIHVTATGSNDSGVSWVVEVEGQRIFHAGDLCNWYARFLANQEHVPQIIHSLEFGDINPLAEEKQFLGELKDIRKVAQSFHLVMFPVDGRIGNGYTLGGRQFIQRFDVGMFVPMHFVASGFESAWRMEPFCQEAGVPFWCIGQEGEQLTSIDGLWIRRALPTDVPRMQEVFAHARRFMAATGNPHQWAETYPSPELLLSDIASGDSYVCLLNGKVVGTFVLREGDDPTYHAIYDGAWPNDEPYATIHRIASNGEVHGLFHTVMQFAMHHYTTIRIDTHRDNRVMQHLLSREGFSYCGIIHCWNGDERLAFISPTRPFRP